MCDHLQPRRGDRSLSPGQRPGERRNRKMHRPNGPRVLLRNGWPVGPPKNRVDTRSPGRCPGLGEPEGLRPFSPYISSLKPQTVDCYHNNPSARYGKSTVRRTILLDGVCFWHGCIRGFKHLLAGSHLLSFLAGNSRALFCFLFYLWTCTNDVFRSCLLDSRQIDIPPSGQVHEPHSR